MAQTPEHYFSAEPASAAEIRIRQVTLNDAAHEVETARGIFSPDHIDAGTAVLLKSVPDLPPSGTFLDVGCGWGPIALTMGLQRPQAQIYAIDVNQRALDLTIRNAARLGLAQITALTPDQVAPDQQFDVIWSNPPIRIGKPELHALLTRWINRLTAQGVAYLVVQKNLGADSLARWLQTTFPSVRVTRISTSGGFRVLEITSPTDSD